MKKEDLLLTEEEMNLLQNKLEEKFSGKQAPDSTWDISLIEAQVDKCQRLGMVLKAKDQSYPYPKSLSNGQGNTIGFSVRNNTDTIMELAKENGFVRTEKIE